MLVKTFTDKKGEVYTLKTDNNLNYSLINTKAEEVGHLILWDKPIENFYEIKDTFIDTKYSGRGIWRQLMYYVLQHIKVKLKAEGLLSFGQMRRPASNKAWKSIEKFAEVKLSNYKKKDYYLRDMKLEQESFSVLSFDEFVNEDIKGLKSATKKKREAIIRMDQLQNRADANSLRYEYYSDKEDFEKQTILLHNKLEAENNKVEKEKIRAEIKQREKEWKDLQAKHKARIKASSTRKQ